MKTRASSQHIDEIAARWAAMIDGRALTPSEEAALESWLAEDGRHAGAFVKARAVAHQLRRAAALDGFDPAQFRPRPFLTRRAWMAGAAAAGLAVMFGVAAGRSGRRLATGIGEMRGLSLEDGSTVTLNTASRVHIRFSTEERLIELDEGEALFDVAKDPKRPFIVVAEGTRVVAVGTSFTVEKLPGQPVRVMVREGVVEMRGGTVAAPMPALRIAANHRAEAGRNQFPRAEAITTADVDQALAWRDGRISLENETLGAAAQTFSRYSQTRIVIDDPQVAAQSVTGLYLANDPVGFAKAVALSLNLTAVMADGEVRLMRK